MLWPSQETPPIPLKDSNSQINKDSARFYKSSSNQLAAVPCPSPLSSSSRNTPTTGNFAGSFSTLVILLHEEKGGGTVGEGEGK